uniref:Coiled-coil domain-containing protein 85C n=1 Tax=Phallusia mammillata TaxID=59560 RepID=A0A6F9D837_9ASCI|nr:coiled-coil domain-containing protein 85C [Phallusia mammillata]
MDYNIQPSSPSSTSSSTASSSSSPSYRGDGFPIIKSLSDEELRREGVDRVIQRLRHAENEHKKLLMERSRSMKDVNRKLQVHLLEVRGVREVNQKLMQDKEILLKEKEELAGICCFLDDDREKAKKVAREWQMFGRYATGVLQKELANCHTKIKELEQRQMSLMHENRNLKELCIMLDQEHAGSRNSVNSQDGLLGQPNALLSVAGTRDSGDGSSNGSTTSTCSPDHRQNSGNTNKEIMYSPDPAHGDSYLRYLEHKVRHLEEESKGRVKRISVPPPAPSATNHPPSAQGIGSPGKLERKFFSSSVLPTSSTASAMMTGNQLSGRVPSLNHLSGSDSNMSSNSMSPQKPEAIVYAMKVLELHDQLDQEMGKGDFPPTDTTVLDDKEKAMVREMCNVVWRKLGDKGKVKMANGKSTVTRTASVSNL